MKTIFIDSPDCYIVMDRFFNGSSIYLIYQVNCESDWKIEALYTLNVSTLSYMVKSGYH